MAKKTLVLVLILFGIVGCSSEPKPSKQDIEKALAGNLAGFLELSDMDIQAMESIGTKVDPKFHSRFVAQIRVLRPTYERIGRIAGGLDSDVVRLVLDEGATFEVYGKAVSVLDRESWRTSITEIDSSVHKQGDLLGKFERPVVDGSKEHQEALEKLKSLERERELAAVEAERAKTEMIQRQSEAFQGKWVGSYICRQGSTGLTLSVETTLNGMSATFEFYPTEEGSGAKSGSFMMTGKFLEDGSFSLNPGAWIKRPDGYNAVGLRGRMNESMDQLAGTVTGGCQTFSLSKN